MKWQDKWIIWYPDTHDHMLYVFKIPLSINTSTYSWNPSAILKNGNHLIIVMKVPFPSCPNHSQSWALISPNSEPGRMSPEKNECQLKSVGSGQANSDLLLHTTVVLTPTGPQHFLHLALWGPAVRGPRLQSKIYILFLSEMPSSHNQNPSLLKFIPVIQDLGLLLYILIIFLNVSLRWPHWVNP